MSAVVGLALLTAIVMLGQEVLTGVAFIVSVIAVREFYSAFVRKGFKPVKSVGYIACLLVLAAGFGEALAAMGVPLGKAALAAVFLIFATLFAVVIFKNEVYSINDAAVSILGIIYVPFLFSFLPLTRNLADGRLLIWTIFIGAWATDTFAYFAGVLFGRRKILPKVSPKKSLEGSIGGLAGCVAAMTAYGVFFCSGLTGRMPVFHFVILGVLCGVISQLGDWAASAVKRYTGIKDYGSIMPGHGGVLDRFDSILFTAPAVFLYLTLVAGLK